MDLSWLVRLRWRLLGAWMWPAFIVFAIVDGVVGHLLPPAGTTETIVAGLLLGMTLNLLAVVVVGPLAGRLLRVRRRDLPLAIARNYAGTACIVLVTVAIALVGLLHHRAITQDRATLRDAAVRAAAWIGDHAPARFRADADELDSFVVQAGWVYRECATADDDRTPHFFCVVVDERQPPQASVHPAGSESNETLSRGLD